jgi:hypothetical protein
VGYEELLELVKQEIGVRQGDSCAPYLFNIFSNVITAHMGEEKLQVQAMKKQIISEDNWANGSFPLSGLLKQMDQTTEHCNQWNVKCNLNKTRVTVFIENKWGEGGRKFKD